jgi:hypothetical protein
VRSKAFFTEIPATKASGSSVLHSVVLERSAAVVQAFVTFWPTRPRSVL